ncbi:MULTISPECIES: DUF6894 family protein [Methylobacterium]|uniref:DUF6894 domain-containing protein n=1 Tax=Methylobacterium thuringiense TaxID=1003091 RepID=A0ABQ4TF31_9HYPH|nr:MULTISPECIES: hypothetical protein [Methylobacterium]TXN19326.1 hypothetical protein FV217_21785 [Methylobacterium sp. WL9]GJE53983.1 hypothetical protein EKPJFOCH_0453 [Methylobacterium thuringiense]
MARYFFDLNDGSDIPDEIGREIADLAALRREALRVMTSLTAAEAEDAKDTTLVMTVRDEAGRTPLKVRLVCQVEEF